MPEAVQDTISRTDSTPPVLRTVKVSKHFGHVQALSEVSLELTAGEIVGLVGDNGAGKSTLIKCISGVYRPDGGHVEIDGQRVALDSPMDARRQGIETVFQDLSLAPDLTVAANVFLGRELRLPGLLGRLGFLDFRQMRTQAKKYIRDIGVDLPSVDVYAELLSGGQRQAVAISRARAWASRVLLLDEPTAALGVRQRNIVLDIIRAGRERGMTILIISHDLPLILEVADRLVILRLGRVAARLPARQATYEGVVSTMLGLEVNHANEPL